MRIGVGHLYPDYLNIYADRGNIAVLSGAALARARARRRGRLGRRPSDRGGSDLYYVGGGQDREQALIAPDLAAKGEALVEAVADGAALLAVCGGYQLLGRLYLGTQAARCPASASSRTRRSPESGG